MASLALVVLLILGVPISSGSVVQVNSGVQVLRGGSVSISESVLKIRVDPNSNCKVEVVLNEPVTQRVGKLTPQMFDCSFLKDEVQYVHNGSPLLDNDTVLLRVYRFTALETQVEMVVLQVRVVDEGSGVVQQGSTPLVVSGFFGLSNPINSTVLSIRVPEDLVCTIRLMTAETQFPMAGRLVREEDSVLRRGRQVEDFCPGNQPCLHHVTEVRFLKTSCQDFLSSGLKYQHLSPPSPRTDYLPIRVELREQGTRKLLESQAFWLPVLINGAVPNQPPKASFMASFILEVDLFILTPFSTAALDATDSETPQNQLVFNVMVPPADGYITHLEDHTKPIRSFTWLDLHDMKVAYQPPNSSQSIRQNLQVEFQAIDGSFMNSPPFLVHLSIRASETNAPRVSWNMGLNLLEGQSRPITWEQLQIVDKDNIDAVYLVAVDGPVHGRLSVRGGKAFMFRVRDLKEGVVIYHHSDSDSTRDHIVFRISDGRHSIRHKFPINILPKDDSPPFLINNVAVEVQEGGTVQLQEYMLLASDLDSSDDFILYQIVSSPRAGQLVRKSSTQETVVPVDSFLQRDLIQGQIYYQHSGDETFEDSFDFTLSDRHQPPNLSQTYTVVVQVFPMKDQLPVEGPGTVRSLTVRETDVVHISRSQLLFIDRENLDADLTYTITQSCFSPLQPGLMDAGRLFYTDSTNSMKKDHMVPILSSFSQHAVNHMKVAFMPPVEDIGPDPLFVQFVFSVSDQHGGTVSGLVFNITVTPVDNLSPEAFTNLLRVEEGGSAFVTEEHLQVQDRDSPDAKLRVEVQRTARHGQLELQGEVLLKGGELRLADLRGLRLRYIHDDSETSEDEVGLRVTDGLNSVDVLLQIQVLPMNDEPPQLGGGLRDQLSCVEGGRVQVTVDYLSATDRDSEDSRLTYMLARSPGRGELQRGGMMTDKFSQQDLLQGHVYYVHSGEEIGPHPVFDTVTLIISDGEAGVVNSCCHGDAPPPPVPLHGTLPVYDLNVTILPVNNKVPKVSLGESPLMVDEGSRACLCGGVLGASDPDSPAEDLTFLLETPPLHGFLENVLPMPGSEKSNAGIPIESFSLTHLTSGLINYVQSEHRGLEPTVDQMSISVSDGLYSSAPVPFYIIINPTNDEPPLLLLTNFTVKEGGFMELTPSILDASDLDVPPGILTFKVERPPAHGTLIRAPHGEVGAERLQKSLPVPSFTLQELREGMKILYLHDDTETLEDTVLLQLTDGVHSVEGTVRVTVMPVNDNKPHLIRNAGLDLDFGERRVISSMVLEAADLDTPPDQVFYFINAAPTFGKLLLKTEPSWAELSAGQNFTQEQVEMNQVWYHHRASSAGFRGHDSFRFILSDVDNESPTQSFMISIRTVNRGEIILKTKTVHLREGQQVVLNTDMLLASDSSGRPEELVFAVSTPPRHGLVHAVQLPGVPLISFTQLDVAAHRICYTHNNDHHSEADSFSFVVTNGASSRSGTLLFTIEHSDRIPPTLKINAGLHLKDGSTATISPDLLQLTDPDTATANLTYIITLLPTNGELLLRGAPLPSPPRFLQIDIDQLDLAYRHNPGNPVELDRFYFLPSDGTNKGYLEFGQLREDPAVFNIQVEPVDRMSPSLSRMETPSTVVDLGAGRYGIFITSRHLQGSDPDSPLEQLEFSIISPPRFGYLENAATGASISQRFHQLDLDQRSVLYILPADVDVTADSFQFCLVDRAGNRSPPQMLELFWSRVQLSASCYRTCETSGTLQIQIQRSGRSVDPAYVSIQVEEGSAKPGRDFTHSSAALIQFDPGVNMKTWNVFPLDDGLEENHETFSITLKSPQNAVLGQRTSATVEIIDPRERRCDPKDLKVETTPLPLPPPLHPKEGGDEDPVIDIEAELLWENQPHPPRGDVPDRRPYLDYEEVQPQDQAVKEPRTRQTSNSHLLRGQTDSRTRDAQKFGSLTPLKMEELQLEGAWWRHHPHGLLPQELDTREAPQTGPPDAPQTDHPREQLQLPLREVGSSLSSSCPDGWTLYRRRCHMVSPSLASWASADRTCSLLFNSSLSSLHSRKDLSWMWRFAGKKSFWIGGSGSQDGWIRANIQSAGPLSDSADLSSGCVLVENPRRWISTNCSAEVQHSFICSSEPVPH
ncbi:PREDICTED: FRAS1-related extracellular matrix protein 1-like [Cyprinodon variegatus]|uniref:Fras1 related extracellular matrix 1b n=1 Tax=Cyprinodon variegatus TaxID=28743 RepID=A0A3Q2E3K9_CYPVA|nr:PREDICTED: FRAS1-related extracellular matrix protein 1-like [Cyprinodon variegatus]